MFDYVAGINPFCTHKQGRYFFHFGRIIDRKKMFVGDCANENAFKCNSMVMKLALFKDKTIFTFTLQFQSFLEVHSPFNYYINEGKQIQ